MSVIADPYGLNGGPVTGDPWGIQKRLADEANSQRIANDLASFMKNSPPIGNVELNAVSAVAPVTHNIPWIPIAGVSASLVMLMMMSR